MRVCFKNKANGRIFTLEKGIDLLDDLVVVTRNGNESSLRIRIHPCASIQEQDEKFESIYAKRLKRGYLDIGAF